MSRSIVFAVCGVIGLSTAPLIAADQWASASVVLKNPLAAVRRGPTGGPLSVFQVGWPATVLKTDGTWALLIGEPGFQQNPEIGWVRVDDLVNGSTDPLSGTDSRDYTAKIDKSSDPATRAIWYWLRGIYWDTNSETRAAIKDYALAILELARCDDGQRPFFANCEHCHNCELLQHLRPIQPGPLAALEPPFPLSDSDRWALRSDCYRRLGTALAADEAVCNYECWEKCFQASAHIVNEGLATGAPRLWYEWGSAYSSAFSELTGPSNPPCGPGGLKGASIVASCVCDELKPAEGDPKDPKHKDPTWVDFGMVATRACDKLKKAAAAVPQWADPHSALGDLYASVVSAQTPPASGLPPQWDVPLLKSAVAEYTDAIQCDSGSNKAYLGRAGALQQLAYAEANTVISPAGSSPVIGELRCFWLWILGKSDCCDAQCGISKDCQKLNQPAQILCKLARRNAATNATHEEKIAFARAKSWLTNADASANAAARVKNFLDPPSNQQFVTTQRDLAFLNDDGKPPYVSYQYAVSAYNLAANGVEFANTIKNGVDLQKQAYCMRQLSSCYYQRLPQPPRQLTAEAQPAPASSQPAPRVAQRASPAVTPPSPLLGQLKSSRLYWSALRIR